jgi:hypothetical protein
MLHISITRNYMLPIVPTSECFLDTADQVSREPGDLGASGRARRKNATPGVSAPSWSGQEQHRGVVIDRNIDIKASTVRMGSTPFMR